MMPELPSNGLLPTNRAGPARGESQRFRAMSPQNASCSRMTQAPIHSTCPLKSALHVPPSPDTGVAGVLEMVTLSLYRWQAPLGVLGDLIPRPSPHPQPPVCLLISEILMCGAQKFPDGCAPAASCPSSLSSQRTYVLTTGFHGSHFTSSKPLIAFFSGAAQPRA